MDKEKLHCCDRFHPPWVLQMPLSSGVFLFLLFLSIYGYSLGKSGHDCSPFQVSSGLHTPMYFSSATCPLWISVTLPSHPKMLADILNEDRAISFLECTVQFYLFCTFGSSRSPISAGSDGLWHFVAICDPLLYMVTMSPKSLCELVSCCYLNGTLCSALIHLCLALQIPSYRSNRSNPSFVIFPSLVSCLLWCYYWINWCLYTLWPHSMRLSPMWSSSRPTCTFSSRSWGCTQQRKVQSLFHLCLPPHCHRCLTGNNPFHLLRPHSGNSMDTDKVATVFYTVVIPMVNPLIYSLRNKDVKEALRKVVNSKILSWEYFPSRTQG